MKSRFLIVLCGAPVILWAACWVLVKSFAPDLAAAGQFGDMFGAVNALFGGLAIAGLVVTYLAQERNHASEMEKLETQLAVERRRVEFEARPIFTLRWRDSSVRQDKSQFGLIVSNHGGAVILLQYRLKESGGQTEGGGIFQSCLVGKDVESPNIISPTAIGVLEFTYVQLRDGRRGEAKFDVLESRHREPRFVLQRPGIVVGSSIVDANGETIDHLPRLDLSREHFEEDIGAAL